ncbi:hypothetical protein [Aliarcobacter butzleri]|uniref:hypothetical protein n=1 Tax=Aliarcobacter butzleri TaxID=28197 RepID=UPI002ED6B951
MESKINRITDILRRDAELDGETYTYILDEKYRWQNWAVLKVDEKKDIINNLSNIKLVIYLSF